MKRSLVLGTMGILLSASVVMPVSAHGHHHSQTYTTKETKGIVCEVCTVEGCEESGHHTHNKQTYCGYAHESGYCDNSCAVTTNATTGRHHGHRRHHGR